MALPHRWTPQIDEYTTVKNPLRRQRDQPPLARYLEDDGSTQPARRRSIFSSRFENLITTAQICS